MNIRWLLPAVAIVGLTACGNSGGIESLDAVATGTSETSNVSTSDPGAEDAETSLDNSESSLGESETSLDDSESNTTSATDTVDTTVPVDEILAELEENGFCDPSDVEGTGDVGTTTAMHFVVDAVPAAPCFGTGDDRLDQAWADLEAVAPPDYLDDISLLAGYEACEGCDTLAFVSALDEAGSFFLMAVDVTAAQDDPDELSLTLLHELSHVFSQDPTTQLDVAIAAGDCETYHNGNGCVTERSYLWDWMNRFWDAETLTTFEQGESDENGGEERCDLGGAYTGPYGASSPEEDFAEVFAAYVFDVEFDGDLDEKLGFFDEFDEFRRIRERAEELGLTGLDNSFERCG